MARVESRASPAAWQPPARFHSLDALRGLAALAVVFWHWQNFFLSPSGKSSTIDLASQPLHAWFRPLYDSGYLAVDLFFALSGFVFHWVYAQALAEQRVSARDFSLLRLSRLYPLHLLTLLWVALGQLVYQAIQGHSFVYPHNDLTHLVLHLAFVPAIGLESGYAFNAPVWSVGVELVLYALFFGVCRYRLTHPALLLAASMFGFFVLSRLYLPLGRGVGAFFLGCCVYLVYRWVLRQRAPGRWTQAIVGAAALLWLATLFCSYTGRSLADVPALRIFAWKYPMLVLFPVTILALALLETQRGTLLRGCSWLGDISYSSYLLHFPLQLMLAIALAWAGVSMHVMLSPVALVAALAVVVVLAWLSHRHFERPLQDGVRRRWIGATRIRGG
jgi:peptidoglycan/LPS O-acetylase OafA/YrhL